MSGLPQPYIQWNKSGEKLSSKTGKIIIKEQEPYIEKGLVIVSSSLLITNLSQSDQSVYTCIGIDSLSIKNYINATREASANLTVLCKMLHICLIKFILYQYILILLK